MFDYETAFWLLLPISVACIAYAWGTRIAARRWYKLAIGFREAADMWRDKCEEMQQAESDAKAKRVAQAKHARAVQLAKKEVA